MIRVGWKKPLTVDDLYDLDPKDGSDRINVRWEENWKKQQEAKRKKGVEHMNVLPTLMATFGWTYLGASVVQLVTILLNLVRKMF
jgi:hypothetical protein